MIRILLASHSELASSLLHTGIMICGKELMSNVETITLKEDGKGILEFKMSCQRFYEENKNDQFLIFTDLVGATPFNVCASVFKDADYYIVTGMNLPMLIDTMLKKANSTLEELAQSAVEAGIEGIKKINIYKVSCIAEEEDNFL